MSLKYYYPLTKGGYIEKTVLKRFDFGKHCGVDGYFRT